jgi:hypothetical protein
MSKNIKLLEERVLQAAGRLRQLSAERRELENELLSLRKRAESLEQSGSAEWAEREENWQTQKAEVITLIRQTLDELKGN